VTDIERNKQVVRAPYEAAQRQAVPVTLPGATEEPSVPKADPSTVISCQDAPGGVNEPMATIAAIIGWHGQTVSPGFTAYGPMIAEGDLVVEEWETFFHGRDGTIYNNHYCWVKKVVDGKIVQVREYIDSHHAFVVLGQRAPWKDLDPPRAPRRRWRPMQPPADDGASQEIETVFAVRQQFDLDPKLLRDPIPGGAAPARVADTAEGAKGVVRAMRDAQGKGDSAAMSSFYAPGFRHFIAGEGPLGWNHLPLQDLYAPLIQHLASPISVRFGPMVAEGGSVFEEMDILARLDDGTVYNNWHCFVHEVRNGQIAQTREYLDTHHLWVVLGRWAEWGKTPVPPLRQARRSNLPTITATYQGRNPFLDLERWHPLPELKT
jgi:ketosteroid isomerase-like protein